MNAFAGTTDSQSPFAPDDTPSGGLVASNESWLHGAALSTGWVVAAQQSIVYDVRLKDGLFDITVQRQRQSPHLESRAEVVAEVDQPFQVLLPQVGVQLLEHAVDRPVEHLLSGLVAPEPILDE